MTKIDWLDVAPDDDAECRDYFVRLIALIQDRVDDEEFNKAVLEALQQTSMFPRRKVA